MADPYRSEPRDPEHRSGAGRVIMWVIIVAIAVFVIAWATGFVNFRTSGSLKAPDVAVTGGEVPSVRMETPDIDVGTRTTTVEVPTVDVDRPEGSEPAQ